MSPPTWRSLLIPTPPDTCNAPVVLLVELVVSVIVVIPDILTKPPSGIDPRPHSVPLYLKLISHAYIHLNNH